jgi:4-hydroxy-2-oxoheptanedioate aldolase
VSKVEQILSVPGLGFAAMGPGDMGLVLGYKQVPRESYLPDMQEARERVLETCRARGIPYRHLHCVFAVNSAESEILRHIP